MDSLSALTGAAASGLMQDSAPAPKDARQAAREFESLWLEQMLHSARPEPDAEDSTRDMVLDMADQQIARLLAAQGGLGLAQLVEQGLAKKPAATAEAQTRTS